jgi:signal-transduction protein with cAMP-binding, CBS, and nucleotidyltransferase domain
MTELNLVEKVIALEGVDLLAGLTAEQLAGIASIATEADFPPGRTILDAARPVDALYVIMDGSVELSRGGEALDVAGRNAVLGVWALFDENDPLRLGAKAREDTRLLRIGRDDFYDLLADDSEITAAVFSALAARFRRLASE